MRMNNLAVVAAKSRRPEKLVRVSSADAIPRDEEPMVIKNPKPAFARGQLRLASVAEKDEAEAEKPALRSALDVYSSYTAPTNLQRRLRPRELAVACCTTMGNLQRRTTNSAQRWLYTTNNTRYSPYRASALMHFAVLLVDRGQPDEAWY